MTSQTDNLTLADIKKKLGGTIAKSGDYIDDANVAGADVRIRKSPLRYFYVSSSSRDKYSREEYQRFFEMTFGIKSAANDNNALVDPWAQAAHPPMPSGLLPPVIEKFAGVNAEMMGADPAGFVMTSLAACGAAIPDKVNIQPKKNDTEWTESARLWVMQVAEPSAKKTPITNAATSPLKKIDAEMFNEYQKSLSEYLRLEKKERDAISPPKQERLVLSDTTIEAAQEILKDSPNGVLMPFDELSSWFASLGKYSGKADADRGFYLQAFNGGSYIVNRIGRGSSIIPNLSASIVGNIQPEVIRKLAKDSADDGLLQRFLPVLLKPAGVGRDSPTPDVNKEFGQLIRRLTDIRRPLQGGMREMPFRFSEGGQKIWEDVVNRNHQAVAEWESINRKFASHVAKYDGLFARMCLLWHCIEAEDNRPPAMIEADLAFRVSEFMQGFVQPHGLAFYQNVLGLSDRQDALLAAAGWILAHKPEAFTGRDVARGDGVMRGLTKENVDRVMEHLDAYGWLEPVPVVRTDSRKWRVRPEVYSVFADRALKETVRRESVRDTIASAAGQHSAAA
ncbi:MAG: hypothetical protein MnENMB40S_37290 [Rhizobiaceae bacterium MnEN-MB40S]|nr:MAG: hypothetical protein MnENMB40S_37290 [Rhizobiaceae bacterium MnEN-MB40S]